MDNKKIQKNTGFVLLYTMIISSIVLLIAMSISAMALKEAQFSISARSANDAFFAADTGSECAIYFDNQVYEDFNAGSNPIPIICAGSMINVYPGAGEESFVWKASVPHLGGSFNGCANIVLTKDVATNKTRIISNGYDKCESEDGITYNPTANSVERQLEVNY